MSGSPPVGHRFTRLLAAAALFLSGPLAALTAEELVLNSAPGAPLRATVLLTLQPGEEPAAITARLADSDGYLARGIERPAIADALHFALRSRGEGRARLEIYSDTPWDGTDTTLLLQLNWPQGELQQQYLLHGQAAAAEPEYVEVNPDDTLDRIAIRLSKGRNRSYLHMMYALYLANPDAFYRGNMNNLKSGVRLRVPGEEELNRLQNREVFAAIREHYRQWQQGGAEGGAGSESGRLLAGLSEAQVGELDLNADPERLHGQLATLLKQNRTIEQENAALRERMAQLEQRMAQMSDRVLELNTEAGSAAAKSATPPAEAPPAREAKPEMDRGEENSTGTLPTPTMLLAILLAVAAAYFIWRAARQGRGRRR